MDITCPKCGEPWDNDCLHESIEDNLREARLPIPRGEEYQALYAAKVSAFRSRGCSVLGNAACTPDPTNPRAIVSGVLLDLLGDDTDGVASIMDDADSMGMFD